LIWNPTWFRRYWISFSKNPLDESKGQFIGMLQSEGHYPLLSSLAATSPMEPGSRCHWNNVFWI
jgi:hypothetical protein